MKPVSAQIKRGYPKLIPEGILMVVMTCLFLTVSLNSSGKSQVFGTGPGENLAFDLYSQEDGLPNNIIQCIYQDRKGWMWFGTSAGLSRFDGYRFTSFINDPSDSTSLSGSLVRVIIEDRSGNLLVGTENGGLNVFDRKKERFSHPYRNHPEFKGREVSVNTIAEDETGNLWIGTDQNLLCLDTTGNLRRVNPVIPDDANSFTNDYLRILNFDRQGKLWIGANTGLFLYDPETSKIEKFPLPFSINDQNSEIWEIYRDTDGLLWIGTYSSGLYIVDPETKSVKPVPLDPFIERTETVRTISKGIFGNYWIGTRGGLYTYSKDEGVTGFYKHDERQIRSLANNSVLDICNDSKGETWIGTRGGINLLAKSKQVFRNFSALPNDRHYLNSSIIYAFWIDEKGKIWIGTEDGGVNIYNPETSTFDYLMAGKDDARSLSQNCIKAFLDDKRGNLWIGTFLGGIDVLDLKTGNITHHRYSHDNQWCLTDNQVWALRMDNNQDIWIGTTRGVDRFDFSTGKFIHYPQIAGSQKVNWIGPDSEGDLWFGTESEAIIYNPSTEKIIRHPEHSRAFIEDSRHRYWIASLDKGLALYSKENGVIRYYNESDGLSNNQALCILEDNNGKLWISTSNGLSRFDPEKEYFQNFTARDGLQNNQFSYGAACKTRAGELLFGGISGFNIFNPDDIQPEDPDIPIVLTDFRIFNKKVPIGGSKKATLRKSISETDELVLDFHQNVITFEFAALNFVNRENNLYSYYLKGFDKGWNEPSTARTATYTNLNPGDYVLNVRRVIPGIQSDKANLTLKITILSPYWRTWWFRSILVLVVAGLFLILIRFFINREKLKNDLAFEKIRARKIHELDMLKLRFFTNISHEIRTPLTLILGPIEKLISKQVSSSDIPAQLQLIQRNAKQLDKLITQLLDFRKLESGNLKLELTQSDLVPFIDEVVHSFEYLAREKEISLKFNTLKKKLIAVFDPDKIEKILNNLISNALKFTGNGGSIHVNLLLVFDSDYSDFGTDGNDKQFIEISVKDTGKGIQPGITDKIFTRFFRAEPDESDSGAGIGLALVKELVKLHKGKIFVVSKPGKGSKFTIHIPYETRLKDQKSAVPELAVGQDYQADSETIPEDSVDGNLDSSIMLIVEDNPDVRFFIRSHFLSKFRIVEAKNGQEGWEKAIRIIPDVIVSDILMPGVDGYEFCRRLKKDERTSHIPVILLTALHSKDHEIEGLSYGADDYITKPFDLNVLQAKIENLLSIRKSLREKYSNELILQPKNIPITSPDERFLQKAIEVVEKNLSDSQLDIETFALQIGVSRMQLYRKLHALTDMTVKEFIRNIRLKRATQLLLQKNMSVSEIAYLVGFNDLSHFRKCFKQEFGMNASEYVKMNL